MLSLRYFAPDPSLARFVRAYYFVDGDKPAGGCLRDRLMPSGSTLRFERRGNWSYALGTASFTPFPSAAFVGPTTTTVAVSTQSAFQLFGIDLTTLGHVTLSSLPVSAVADRCEALDDVLESDWSELEARIFNAPNDSAVVDAADAFLLRKIGARQHNGVRAEGAALINLVQRSAERQTPVADIARAMDLSERQVERLSRTYLGYAPSRALRRVRFMNAMRAIIAAPSASWIDVAGEGYFDQSHFVREFRAFAGMTPGQFARRQSRFLGTVEPIVVPSAAQWQSQREQDRLPVNGYRVPDNADRIVRPTASRSQWSCNARSTMDFVSAA